MEESEVVREEEGGAKMEGGGAGPNGEFMWVAWRVEDCFLWISQHTVELRCSGALP